MNDLPEETRALLRTAPLDKNAVLDPGADRFNPLAPPAGLTALPADCYEPYLTPTAYALRERGLSGGMAVGWRLTAAGRALAEAERRG